MNSPFPGMNPYLENPVFWSELHHRFITAIADTIEENIPPQYRVAIEQRIYLSDDSDSVLVSIPDVSVVQDITWQLIIIKNQYHP